MKSEKEIPPLLKALQQRVELEEKYIKKGETLFKREIIITKKKGGKL